MQHVHDIFDARGLNNRTRTTPLDLAKVSLEGPGHYATFHARSQVGHDWIAHSANKRMVAATSQPRSISS
jgi:hypothetical protein